MDTFVSQWQTFLCSYLYIYTRRFIFFWAVLFLNDSYKSARVIDNASQDLHAFLQIEIFFPTIRVFPLSLLHFHTTVCVFNVTKCDAFLPLQLCWMYVWSISKCEAICLSAFVVAWFSTWLLPAIVESCYRLIGDEMCVQKLNDKNWEFKNLRMTTILY